MGNQQVRLNTQNLIKVPNTDNYFVDSEGNIYSTARQQHPKKLSPYKHFGKSKNPYMRVKMGGKLYLCHRVVASAKIGRPLLEGEFVNHINGNTIDNSMDNLEVVSHKENVMHAVANNLYCSGEAWYKARGIVKCSVNFND